MKLSTLIAKIEDSTVRASKVIAAKTATLVKDVKVEVKAARIARGAAEQTRVDEALALPLTDGDAARVVVEAAEIDMRAREIELERLRREEQRDEAQRRREYIRKITTGEIKIP